MKFFEQRNNPAALIVLVAVLILTAMTALAAPAWQGHEDYEDGILTVYNTGGPTDQPSVIKPEPQWRIGDEDEVLFGLVTDAQRAHNGTTYLLDAVMSTVYEISPTGEVRRTLGHEGDGPGEFRNAVSLALLPDRNVGIVEMMPSHMVVLDHEGLPRPSIELGDGEGERSHVQSITVDGDRMVMGLFSTRFNEGSAEIRHTLGTFDLEGALQHKVLHSMETQSGGSISISTDDDNDFINNWVVGPNGQIAVYRRTSQYLVEVFGADGQPVRNIRREYESLRRPDDELADARRQQEQMRERFGGSMEMEIEEMARDISEVIARPNGDMWVMNSRGERECPAGHIGIFDVFDTKGHFVRTLRLEADYSADDDQYLIRGNHLYVLKEAQNAPDRTFSGGGGNMMMVMSSGGGGEEEEDDDEEPRPYEVICYELPDGI